MRIDFCQPTRWEKLVVYDPVDRFLDCKCYDRCLNLAAERGWRGFTCRFCDWNIPKEEEPPNEMPTM